MWRLKIDGYFKAEVPCIFRFVKYLATVARDISFSINYISILDTSRSQSLHYFYILNIIRGILSNMIKVTNRRKHQLTFKNNFFWNSLAHLLKSLNGKIPRCTTINTSPKNHSKSWQHVCFSVVVRYKTNTFVFLKITCI